MTGVMLRVGHQQTWSNEAQIGGLPAKGFKQQNADFVVLRMIVIGEHGIHETTKIWRFNQETWQFHGLHVFS